MNSKQFRCFDNFFPLLLGCSSLGLWLILAHKFIARIVGESDVVGIKLERGVGWKNVGNVMIWSMYLIKWKKKKKMLLRF